MTRAFYYTQEQCEAAAGRALQRYQLLTGERLALPIDVDLIGEEVCGLVWDWADIADDDGCIIWGRLLPIDRRVEMNERYVRELEDNRGLDRFTRGHEIGHWELHAEHAASQQLPLLSVEAAQPVVYCRGRNKSWTERHADWFAAALLMPRDLFCAAARDLNLRRWNDMKALKSACDVSWPALYIRLGTFGIAFMDHNGVERGT